MSYTEESGDTSSNGSSIGGIIILAFFICSGFFIYNKWIKKDYSRPWWTGTETQTVCKRPYYSTSDCYKLPVTSDGETISQVNFPNGGYLTATSSNCEAAASFYNFKQICDISDQRGDGWDILPYTASF